ncbi:hypothetical protein MTP99_006003 [Tenebrio molitor]|nr:hypothetical protein MTP99_006003 [Tenebrio molitor]
MAEVNNRPVFKMNNDFWNQARGPPQSMAQNLSSSNQNSPVPPPSTNSIPAHSPSQQSNSSQNHVVTPGALALQTQQNQQSQQQNQQVQQGQSNGQQNQQQQQQQQQQNQNQQQQQQLGSPNSHSQVAQAHAHALAQVQAQQQLVHMSQQHQLTSGQSSPDKMAEKLVNDLQLLSQLTLPDFNQLQRNSTSSAISERTLEECWTTLQRVSWILFNRVEYSSKQAIFLFRFHPGTLRRTDGRTPVHNGDEARRKCIRGVVSHDGVKNAARTTP